MIILGINAYHGDAAAAMVKKAKREEQSAKGKARRAKSRKHIPDSDE